jgi:ubiquinone/menaquinone biosynthesis C-methylase UbiE
VLKNKKYMENIDGLKFLNKQEIFDKLNLQQGMNVACLGCGNQGAFIVPAAKLVGKDGLAYAVDIQKPVLESVRHLAALEGLTNLQTVWANLEDVGSANIPAGSLDSAFLINVLFQNKKYAEILKEAGRLLKLGGKLIIVDWKKTGVLFGPDVAIRVEPEIIIKLSADLNLKLVLQTEFGQYFWGLIFEKS